MGNVEPGHGVLDTSEGIWTTVVRTKLLYLIFLTGPCVGPLWASSALTVGLVVVGSLG